MRVALAALIVMLLSGAAEAQYALDAKGRRYQCLPGDWSCSGLPPPGTQVWGVQRRASRHHPPPFTPCGSRCDLLDRMK